MYVHIHIYIHVHTLFRQQYQFLVAVNSLPCIRLTKLIIHTAQEGGRCCTHWLKEAREGRDGFINQSLWRAVSMYEHVCMCNIRM